MAVIRTSQSRWGIGVVVIGGLLALAITVWVGVARSQAAPHQVVTVGSATPVGEAVTQVFVHVSGAVVNPGVYPLAPSARVLDVVAAAGGFSPDARQDSVNLARTVADGEQVRVASVTETAEPEQAGPGLVNVNTATVAELDTLPRIGPALADRIVQWRETHGTFTRVDDLLAVTGIGDKLLAGLRDLVTV